MNNLESLDDDDTQFVINESDNCIDDNDKYKTTRKILGAISVKCKLPAVINDKKVDNKLKLIKIFSDLAIDYNKISVEGIWLLTMYIMVLIKNHCLVPINSTTIRRCFGLLQCKQEYFTRSTGENKEEMELLLMVFDQHFQFNPSNKPEFFHDETAFSKPFELCANSFLNNLFLYVRMCFFKNQKKYLKSKINIEFETYKLERADLSMITVYIQKKINGSDYLPTKQANINRLNKLKTQIKNLNDFIEHEKFILKYSIDDLSLLEVEDNMLCNVNNDNIIKYLSYFSSMLEYLKLNEKERFTLLPIFLPKIKFFRFEPRILCTIYNKYKELTGDNEIGTTDFTNNFYQYFDELFIIRKKFSNRLKKYPEIKSIQTDGYTVIMTFEQIEHKKILKDKKEREAFNVKQQEKWKKTKEEFKAGIKDLNEKIYTTKQNLKLQEDQILDIIKFEKKLAANNKLQKEIADKLELTNDPAIIKKLKNLSSSATKFRKDLIEKETKSCNLEIKSKIMQLQKDIDNLENQKQCKNESIKKHNPNPPKKKINLEEILDPTIQNIGLYESTEVYCSEEFLSKYICAGGDPGNNPMVHISTENGIDIKIHKNEYNDLARTTLNRYKISKLQKEKNMDIIIKELSETCHKTHDIDEFRKYITKIRNNWNEIWSYYMDKRILKIDFEKYSCGQSAITEIANRIITRLKDQSNTNKYYKTNGIINEQNDKPLILFFGKGNGNLTISNTKGSSSKGPIRKLINALSKKILVILLDEYKTSQLCNICEEQLENIETYHFPGLKKLKKNADKRIRNKKDSEKEEDIIKEEIKENKMKIDLTKELREKIHKLKIKKKDRSIKEIVEIEKQISELEKQIDGIKCNKVCCFKSSYHLRRCANQHHIKNNINGCKLYERNYNAAQNMIKVGKSIITQKGKRGNFSRKKVGEAKSEANSEMNKAVPESNTVTI